MTMRLAVAATLLLSCDSTPRHTLTVTLTGDGAGAVSANGLSCSGTTCTGSYDEGTSVPLTAAPDGASVFGGWDGACTGSGACTVKIDRNARLSASFLLAQRQVSVAIRIDGGGIATVGSDTPGLQCNASACTGTFATGATIKLTAFPLQTRFVRWTGKCSSVAPECTFSPGEGDNSITAVFLNANYVFTTSTQLSPLQLSLARADAECNARAAAAQLPGNYVAWLSTQATAARSRLGSARGWVRLDGLPFADTVDSLTAGVVLYPVAFDETGAAPSLVILTGTAPDGTAGDNCADFTDPAANVSVGNAAAGTNLWTFEGTFATCKDLSLSVYCFGTDASRPLPAPQPPIPARKAFLSRAAVTGDSGVAGFDAVCSSEAATAGLPGTYLALVATLEASAASRFDLTGPPWARVDGVVVTAKAADLATPSLIAPIDVTADGAYSTAGQAWTGAFAPGQPGQPGGAAAVETTCGDWTGTTANPMGSLGVPALTQTPGQQFAANFFHAFELPCSIPAAVYCLQQ